MAPCVMDREAIWSMAPRNHPLNHALAFNHTCREPLRWNDVYNCQKTWYNDEYCLCSVFIFVLNMQLGVADILQTTLSNAVSWVTLFEIHPFDIVNKISLNHTKYYTECDRTPFEHAPSVIRLKSSITQVLRYLNSMILSICKWRFGGQEQVSRIWIDNYTPQFQWDVVSYLYPRSMSICY